MKIVKDPLKEKVLLENIKRNEPVYTESEAEFLRQFVKHIFTDKSIDELLQVEEGRLGINQNVFNQQPQVE